MDTPMIMAAAGIGIAVVLLAVLSLLQTARARRVKEEKLNELQVATSGLTDAPPGATPFFIACFRGSNARYFRVYVDEGALLFIYAGPYFIMIDAETPRGSDQQHWLLRSLKMLVATLASGGVAAVIAVAVIARAMSRNPNADPTAAGNIILGVLAIIGLLAVGVVILIPSVLLWMTRRGAELDAMSLRALREHAETHEQSFRTTPDNTSDVKIMSLEADTNLLAQGDIGARVTFQHKPTGKWSIEIPTRRDTNDAIEAFLGVFGRERVHVDQWVLHSLAHMPETTKA